MHILWTMIKVLGLILLWLLVILLSLLLLAVLSIVFAPVRYDIQGEGSTRDGTYNGKGAVWWLFHLVHATASIEKGGQRFGIYVLGIPIHKLLAGKKDREKKQEEMPAPETPPRQEEGSPEGEMTEDGHVPPEPGERRGWLRRLPDRIREWYGSLRRGIRRAADSVRAVYERTGSAKETAAWYVRLWNEGTTVAARKLIIGELRCLLRHWKPRKVEGSMVFGLGDPADTGFALALLALFYPASKGRLAVSPDFERAVLEGLLRVRGHMRSFWPLKSAVRLFIAPEIRATYHKWQTRKDG